MLQIIQIWMWFCSNFVPWVPMSLRPFVHGLGPGKEWPGRPWINKICKKKLKWMEIQTQKNTPFTPDFPAQDAVKFVNYMAYHWCQWGLAVLVFGFPWGKSRWFWCLSWSCLGRKWDFDSEEGEDFLFVSGEFRWKITERLEVLSFWEGPFSGANC